MDQDRVKGTTYSYSQQRQVSTIIAVAPVTKRDSSESSQNSLNNGLGGEKGSGERRE